MKLYKYVKGKSKKDIYIYKIYIEKNHNNLK